MNPIRKVEPDSVWSIVLSRISLRNWTCGDNSEPNAAVAMRQPPPSFTSFTSIGAPVLGPIEKAKLFLLTEKSFPKIYVMPHGMLDPYFQTAKDRKLKALRNDIYWKLWIIRLLPARAKFLVNIKKAFVKFTVSKFFLF